MKRKGGLKCSVYEQKDTTVSQQRCCILPAQLEVLRILMIDFIVQCKPSNSILFLDRSLYLPQHALSMSPATLPEVIHLIERPNSPSLTVATSIQILSFCEPAVISEPGFSQIIIQVR